MIRWSSYQAKKFTTVWAVRESVWCLTCVLRTLFSFYLNHPDMVNCALVVLTKEPATMPILMTKECSANNGSKNELLNFTFPAVDFESGCSERGWYEKHVLRSCKAISFPAQTVRKINCYIQNYFHFLLWISPKTWTLLQSEYVSNG